MSAAKSFTMRANMGEGPCDLRVVRMGKRYEGFALGPVSLDVPRGSVVGLVGQNGAGKTTLIKCALGTTRPDEGEVELFGQRVGAMGPSELAALKARLGYVSTTTAYPAGMSVLDVRRTYELAYPGFDGAEFARLAALMGLLPGNERKRVRDLSRGMGMKLQLACALSCGASFLVMDEPTAGLDPIVRDEVLGCVRAWMEPGDRSVLVSSHITSDLDRLADYIVLIDEGAVILSAARDDLARMGVAHLRSAELERVLADGLMERPRVLRHDLSLDVLVPDRAGFLRAYPDYECDAATIDDVMVLVVKGEVR